MRIANCKLQIEIPQFAICNYQFAICTCASPFSTTPCPPTPRRRTKTPWSRSRRSRAALSRLGHQPQPVPCTLDLAALRADLTRLRPDVVFNLVESLADADSLLYLPPAVLDAMGLPYAGSRTEALFLTTHKLLAKQRMREAGLPTPAWIVVPASAGCREPCPTAQRAG